MVVDDDFARSQCQAKVAISGHTGHTVRGGQFFFKAIQIDTLLGHQPIASVLIGTDVQHFVRKGPDIQFPLIQPDAVAPLARTVLPHVQPALVVIPKQGVGLLGSIRKQLVGVEEKATGQACRSKHPQAIPLLVRLDGSDRKVVEGMLGGIPSEDFMSVDAVQPVGGSCPDVSVVILFQGCHLIVGQAGLLVQVTYARLGLATQCSDE